MSRVLVTALGMVVALALSTSAFAQASVEKGKALYEAQKCSLCHSIDGKGNAKGPLDSVGKKPIAEVKKWITDPKAMTAEKKAERKPFMKEYKSLSAEEVDSLVAYMMTLKK